MKFLRPTHHSLHWTLYVVFHDDQSRLRKGHGAVNMAVMRHFALNLVRTLDHNKPIKRRRKMPDGAPNTSPEFLASYRVNPDSEPCNNP